MSSDFGLSAIFRVFNARSSEVHRKLYDMFGMRPLEGAYQKPVRNLISE